MKGEDYRRILDFFFSGVEVSEELKQRYLGWLAAYGDEPEVKALLEEYWDSVSSDSPDFDLTAGLERLMASLERMTLLQAQRASKGLPQRLKDSDGCPICCTASHYVTVSPPPQPWRYS